MTKREPMVERVRAGLLGLVAGILLVSGATACRSPSPAAAPVGAKDVAPKDELDPASAARLGAAVRSPRRPPTEAVRDAARHPYETLTFFGVKEDAKVIELWPGAGWYTAILAPYLSQKGALAVVAPLPQEAEGKKRAEAYAARLAGSPELFAKVEVRAVAPHPGEELSLGRDGSADVVVTFRNFHNWVKAGIATEVLEASFRVLKPGGVLGVEEHRATRAPGVDAATTKQAIETTGYVPEDFLIAAAEKAGFRLEARSEINANPRDTKDYPQGVWTLPPTLRLGNQDRAKYVAIGESDRATLRFRKP